MQCVRHDQAVSVNLAQGLLFVADCLFAAEQDMLVKQIEGHTICALGDAGGVAGHVCTAACCLQRE
jgi:hypothetical protein